MLRGGVDWLRVSGRHAVDRARPVFVEDDNRRDFDPTMFRGGDWLRVIGRHAVDRARPVFVDDDHRRDFDPTKLRGNVLGLFLGLFEPYIFYGRGDPIGHHAADGHVVLLGLFELDISHGGPLGFSELDVSHGGAFGLFKLDISHSRPLGLFELDVSHGGALGLFEPDRASLLLWRPEAAVCFVWCLQCVVRRALRGCQRRSRVLRGVKHGGGGVLVVVGLSGRRVGNGDGLRGTRVGSQGVGVEVVVVVVVVHVVAVVVVSGCRLWGSGFDVAVVHFLLPLNPAVLGSKFWLPLHSRRVGGRFQHVSLRGLSSVRGRFRQRSVVGVRFPPATGGLRLGRGVLVVVVVLVTVGGFQQGGVVGVRFPPATGGLRHGRGVLVDFVVRVRFPPATGGLLHRRCILVVVVVVVGVRFPPATGGLRRGRGVLVVVVVVVVVVVDDLSEWFPATSCDVLCDGFEPLVLGGSILDRLVGNGGGLLVHVAHGGKG